MEGTQTPIQSIVDIFSTELADVRFADVDAPTLTRLVTAVEAATEAVASAQAIRDVAQAELRERQRVLLEYAQRALAYARVYAENNEILCAKLDSIALPRAMRRKTGEETLVLSPAPEVEGVQSRRRSRTRPDGTAHLRTDPSVFDPEVPPNEALTQIAMESAEVPFVSAQAKVAHGS